MPARTTTTRYEHPLGAWTHVARTPTQALAPLMYRELIGFDQERASFRSWLESPRPALTLMIDLRGSIRENGERLPGAWLCGLHDTYTLVEFESSYASVDLELTPLGAYQVLGRPLSELKGRVVALEDLFGQRGSELADRVCSAARWEQRFEIIERFLVERAHEGPRPTPAVEWAYGQLRSSGGGARIEALAASVGCSRRYLTGRFHAEVGMAPKTVARLIRFEHVCRRLRAQPARWAEIAAQAGFSDQPHLNREFRELAGTTPSDFLARCIPDGGVVGDDVAASR